MLPGSKGAIYGAQEVLLPEQLCNTRTPFCKSILPLFSFPLGPVEGPRASIALKVASMSCWRFIASSGASGAAGAGLINT